MKNEYEQQANDFLAKTNTTIKVEFLKHDFHFAGDKDKRDIYKVTISRGSRKFSFDFGNSLFCSGEYVGRKNICLNKFKKYCFTAYEIKSPEIRWDLRILEIVKNPNFKVPNNYDILACLQKYDVGSLIDFCSDFGYDEDSKTAEKTYNAVCKEYDNVCKIWNDEEIEQLQEIQ